MPPWFVATVEVAAAEVELAADLLWQAGAAAVSEMPARSPGTVVLTGAFAERDLAAAAADQLAPTWPAGVEQVADESYLDTWRAHARWERVDRVVVHPVWLPVPVVGDGDIVIHLEPGRAFGSGAHPTTKLALAGLQRAGCEGRRVLDVGTGSGVLAVAAARLGAAHAVAVDIDGEARRVAAANAARNGVEAVVTVGESIDAVAPGEFDVVVANLGGVEVVRHLAGALRHRLAGGGALIVSGLLAGTSGEAVAALGLVAVDVDALDGWESVTLASNRRRIDAKGDLPSTVDILQ